MILKPILDCLCKNIESHSRERGFLCIWLEPPLEGEYLLLGTWEVNEIPEGVVIGTAKNDAGRKRQI